VETIAGVGYRKVDNGGLHIAVDRRAKVLDVDSVIVCAGQEPRRDLVTGLEKAGLSYSLVGGADQAMELDAKRAIEQASRLAAEL
jgi:2,4-dienoyl-CoA reductase (NADPH2)